MYGGSIVKLYLLIKTVGTVLTFPFVNFNRWFQRTLYCWEFQPLPKFNKIITIFHLWVWHKRSTQHSYKDSPSLHEKCPNTELFLVRIFLYSVRIQENTDQKLHAVLFTQFFAQIVFSILVYIASDVLTKIWVSRLLSSICEKSNHVVTCLCINSIGGNSVQITSMEDRMKILEIHQRYVNF